MYLMWNAVYNVINPLLCKTVTKLVSANPWHLTTGYSFHERTHGYTVSIVYLRFHKQNSVKQMKEWRSVQFSSVTQPCPTLCDPMNRSTPGLPVHHQLPEFTQTHVHRVGDTIQPSHPLLSPSPPAPNPSQHQGLFQ